MRTGLITTGLLALALQGCGGGDTTNDGSATARSSQQAVAPSAGGGAAASAVPALGSGSSSSAKAPASSSGTAAQAGGFVAAGKGGRAPAAMLVGLSPADVSAEARQLSRSGIGSIAVPDATSVGALRVALAQLRSRPEVDPARIAVVGEGRGAALAAQLLAREPIVSVAVLEDATASATRPLGQLHAAQVLLQHGKASGLATKAAAERLVAAAPPGTMLYEYPTVHDPQAVRERASWLRYRLR